MKWTTLKAALSINWLLLLSAYDGCGGHSHVDGSISDNQTPPTGDNQTQPDDVSPTIDVQGLAIDGYLEGATAFLDYNFNGVMDENEPRDLTDQNGRFDIDAAEADAECNNFAPIIIDVPVGAWDSDYGVVNEPYRLTFPPAFSSNHISTNWSITTPFTTAIWSAIEVEVLKSGVNNCKELAANAEVQADIKLKIIDQENTIARRYSIENSDIYTDFIANQNTDQHSLAKVLTRGLVKAYTETAVLKKDTPEALLAAVQYYVVQKNQITGEWTQWYREEDILTNTNHNQRLVSVNDDLTTELKVVHYSEELRPSTTGNIQKSKLVLVDESFQRYGCSLLHIYTANKGGFSEQQIQFQVSQSVLKTSYTACLAANTFSRARPSGNVTIEKRVDGRIKNSGVWSFNLGNDAYVDLLMTEAIADSITNTDSFQPLLEWDTQLGATESYGANKWIRTAIEYLPNNTTKQVEITSRGLRIETIIFANGTRHVRCGSDVNSLVEVTDVSLCYSL